MSGEDDEELEESREKCVSSSKYAIVPGRVWCWIRCWTNVCVTDSHLAIVFTAAIFRIDITVGIKLYFHGILRMLIHVGVET